MRPKSLSELSLNAHPSIFLSFIPNAESWEMGTSVILFSQNAIKHLPTQTQFYYIRVC